MTRCGKCNMTARYMVVVTAAFICFTAPQWARAQDPTEGKCPDGTWVRYGDPCPRTSSGNSGGSSTSPGHEDSGHGASPLGGSPAPTPSPFPRVDPRTYEPQYTQEFIDDTMADDLPDRGLHWSKSPNGEMEQCWDGSCFSFANAQVLSKKVEASKRVYAAYQRARFLEDWTDHLLTGIVIVYLYDFDRDLLRDLLTELNKEVIDEIRARLESDLAKMTAQQVARIPISQINQWLDDNSSGARSVTSIYASLTPDTSSLFDYKDAGGSTTRAISITASPALRQLIRVSKTGDWEDLKPQYPQYRKLVP